MDHTVYPSAGLSQSRQHIPLHSDHLSNYPPLLPAPPQPQQHPQWQHQPQQHPQQQQQPSRQSTQQRMRVTDDTMASTSDFVKKLYKMLEDQSFQHVVAWGPQGDCFVVKDMNEFTKSILPRMFKHSNFASFVRQLNKYDFHKVKNTDDNQFGEHSWTFRHPDFHADRRDALENIKRKVPTQRKSLPNQRSTSPSGYGHMHSSPSSSQLEALQHQIERLTQAQEEMSAHVRSLERNYQDVLVEMVNFQRNMAQQDNLMQNLIQYFLQVENGKSKNRPSQEASAVLSHLNELARRTSSAPSSDPFLSSLYPPTALAQNISNSAGASTLSASSSSNLSPPPNPNTSSASSLSSSASSSASASTSRVWQQAATAGLINPAELGSGPSQLEKAMTRQEALSKIEQLKRTNRSVNEQSLANIYSMAAKGRDEAREALALNNWDVVSNPSLALGVGVEQQMAQQGLEVYTLGHLMPKEEQPQSSTASPDSGSPWGSFDPNGLGVGSLLTSQDGPSFEQKPQSSSSSQPSTPTYSTEAASSSSALVPSGGADASPQKLRVRRTTIVPAWAVPPRVLLVDDDAVSRKLSSKFLQVFGCTIDVAVDGVGAVNKMNIEKYDLVLMDIVMPKLDGVSATSMIRKFDHMTPIISMTSNSKPSQIMTYFSSGMNDILQKPFTKQGLLDMLEKHLMHLKVIQQMSQVPRSVGVPPLSDAGFEQALQTHAAAITASSSNASSSLIPTQPTGDTNMDYLPMGGFGPDMDDGRVNPLASMGLTDDMYQAMLQNLIVTGQFPQAGGVDMSGVGDYNGSNKRPLDDAIDGREGKRSRFEVIE